MRFDERLSVFLPEYLVHPVAPPTGQFDWRFSNGREGGRERGLWHYGARADPRPPMRHEHALTGI